MTHVFNSYHFLYYTSIVEVGHALTNKKKRFLQKYVHIMILKTEI